MGDYRLSRARSAVVLRSRSLERPATLLVTRSRSVPDFTRHLNYSYKYRPSRYYCDYGLYDDYWHDRHYYSSPLYKTTISPRRYYYSDLLSNPFYWMSPYYNRYSGYNYDLASYYPRRYYDPSYPSYYRSFYNPYRSSSAFDTWYSSLGRGLSLHRYGAMPYSTYDRFWLTPSYWDRRNSDWRQMHHGEIKPRQYTPSSVEENAHRQYATVWTS